MGNAGVLTQLRRAIGRGRRNRHRVAAATPNIFVNDIQTRLPHLNVRTVFDVGAHIGTTALEFADAWPEAEIYAFEPSVHNFPLMKSNLIGAPHIKLIPLGLSDAPGSVEFLYDTEHPSMSRIGSGSGVTETITLDTIDNYCNQNGVQQIDVMKIDVEGHEMKVLGGALPLLQQSRIGVIRLECAVDPDHDYHLPFFDLTDFLFPMGYRLFGIYEQFEDTLNPSPPLRRFDAAFISAPLVKGRS